MQDSSHRRHAWRLIALVSLICPAMSAWAQQADRPLPLPKSEVAVIYQIDKATDAPRKLQLTYSDAGERVRVDYFRWVEAKDPLLDEDLRPTGKSPDCDIS